MRSEVENAGQRLARRPWPTTPIRPGIDVSFEFFPPASPSASDQLAECVSQLAPLAPRFMSVTYGAGGTTQDRTIHVIEELGSSTGVPIAGHLTCVGANRATVDKVIDRYASAGVNHIVALRGDLPKDRTNDVHNNTYQDAAALVAAIRSKFPSESFEISVAAYPETHPMATSPEADIENLKRKIDAGATRAITQYFFDNNHFLRFLERARGAGIAVPIVPGIMPVTNFASIARFSERCGTSIPSWLPDLFGGLDAMPEVGNLVAATVAAEQCRELVEHGVREFHFYTMNRPQLSLATCHILGVRPNVTATTTQAVAS
ncbi:MAG: methylenetetrahydrofolate reductase [NAD(P)H] [Acidimicrobiales bacterium]|nr:methylenetetrahydrofolate reductase [NAD(P)H] [Acidimicrobiales bacterium]